MATFGLAVLSVGGCAQRPQQFAAAGHGKEYFPSSVYGRASRRVIADGQPVPRGGGQYLVGKPYSVAGQTYYPSERKVVQTGYASWYGDAFHGRLTANGEVYDRDSFTAAHPTMPLPSYARVTNLRNNYSMIVRVNDRGPYASNRVMDVSRRVAEALDFKRHGTAPIRVEYVGGASLAGSDDARLYATLRTNGPARWQGGENSTMVAEAAPRARVASLEPYVPRPAATPPLAQIEEQRPEALAAYRVKRVEPARKASFVQEEPAVRRHAQYAEEPIVLPVVARRDRAVAQQSLVPTSKRASAWATESTRSTGIRSGEMPHLARAIVPRTKMETEARLFAERELRPTPRAEPVMRTARLSASPAAHATKGQVDAVGGPMPPSRPQGLGAGFGRTAQVANRRHSTSLRMARSGE